MTDKPIIYTGPWITAYLCERCGEYLSGSVTGTHWGKPCHRCGATNSLCPATIRTSRRFICTTKRWFRADKGYYEWSGISSDGKVPSNLMKGRRMSSGVTTIAAAGVASGLL